MKRVLRVIDNRGGKMNAAFCNRSKIFVSKSGENVRGTIVYEDSIDVSRLSHIGREMYTEILDSVLRR